MTEELAKLAEATQQCRSDCAEHIAVADVLWKHQQSMNDKLGQLIDAHDSRIANVERKMIWWSGFAAAGGAIVGQFLQLLAGHIGK